MPNTPRNRVALAYSDISPGRMSAFQCKLDCPFPAPSPHQPTPPLGHTSYPLPGPMSYPTRTSSPAPPLTYPPHPLPPITISPTTPQSVTSPTVTPVHPTATPTTTPPETPGHTLFTSAAEPTSPHPHPKPQPRHRSLPAAGLVRHVPSGVRHPSECRKAPRSHRHRRQQMGWTCVRARCGLRRGWRTWQPPTPALGRVAAVLTTTKAQVRS